MVVKVHSVCTLESAPLKLTQAIAKALGITSDTADDLTALKSAIITSEIFKAKFKGKENPNETWFCFGKSNNYICALPDFKEQEHKVIIPSKLEHSVLKTNEDKLGILVQMAQYNIDEEIWLLWKDLLLPQIWDVCKEFGVSVKRERDTISKLQAKVTKAAKFVTKYGKTSIDKLEFKFKISDPYVCVDVALHNRTVKTPAVKENVLKGDKNIEDDENNMNNEKMEAESSSNSTQNDTMENSNTQNAPTCRKENKGDKEIEVEFKKLTGDQFVSLLDIFQLVANPEDAWDVHWTTLHYSKHFLKIFGACETEDMIVIFQKGVIVNVKSKDGSCCLKKSKCLYPCVECSKEVTDGIGTSGEGLQCNKCNRFFHNQCMANPVSKALYNALSKSPDYIQIFCQDCMNTRRMVEKISTDMETMKKEMTWAAKVSNGMAQNVEKAVDNIEKTTKTNNGLMKRLPTNITGHSTEEMRKMKEEKMDRTAVITKPDMKTTNSWEIRKEFNKHFPEIAIKAAIPTATGSVRLEFESKESRDGVISDWKDTMFGGNKGIKAPTVKPTVGLIKGVNTEESIEDIEEEIQASYPGTTVDFFKRDMKITGTIKLIFRDHESYNKAQNDGGIKICAIKYLMEQFVFKPRVIRCFKCQAYGHISKNCRAKQAICGKCCKVGHESQECEATLSNGPVCIHCKGSHFTGSKFCSEYKRVEDKIKSMSHGF